MPSNTNTKAYVAITISLTVLACLGWSGVLTIVGLDLTQAYEASGMHDAYIACTLIAGVSTLASACLWARYCISIRRSTPEYYTLNA
jgi:hypothetical protein